MSLIDDQYRKHDAETIKANEAAKKAKFLTLTAESITSLTKSQIEKSFNDHSFSGYYGYSYHLYSDPDLGADTGTRKPVFVSHENIPKEYGDAYEFYKFRKSEYSLDDMNYIKNIVEGKFRELGLRKFTVKIVSDIEVRFVEYGLFRPKYEDIPVYLIWVECEW